MGKPEAIISDSMRSIFSAVWRAISRCISLLGEFATVALSGEREDEPSLALRLSDFSLRPKIEKTNRFTLKIQLPLGRKKRLVRPG